MAGGRRSDTGGSIPRPPKRRAAAARPALPAPLGLTPRRSVAAMRSEAAQSLQRFVRQDCWNGVAAGDVVRVAGHSARGRHWRFRAHVTNTSNGATWVEVALVDGPPPSRRPTSAASPPADDVAGTGVGTGGQVSGAPARVEKVRSFDPALITPRWRGRGRVVATLLRPGSGQPAPSRPAPEEPSQALSQQTSLF
jgi:hypothetical protein